jgi:hypothetical protein
MLLHGNMQKHRIKYFQARKEHKQPSKKGIECDKKLGIFQPYLPPAGAVDLFVDYS